MASTLMTRRALQRIHTGDAQPARALTIGGKDFTPQLRSMKVEFSGASGAPLEVRDDLSGLEGAPVVLKVGYGGKLSTYFSGTLQEPAEMKRGKATAYGELKSWGDIPLGAQVTYQGVTLGYVFRDLASRAGTRGLSVIGGENFTLATLSFNEETKLIEVAKSIADPANFIYFDRPGRGPAVMPRPGFSGQIKAAYTEANYPPPGFKPVQTTSSRYVKVVVFRRDSGGNYVVREESPVPRRGRIPANRVYYVPNFPGDAGAAKQEAYDTAMALSAGEYSYELSGIWINPDLGPHDAVTVERTEKRPSGSWLVTYRCEISDVITLEITPTRHHMTLKGRAIKIRQVRIIEPARLVNTLTPGMYIPPPPPRLEPRVGQKPRPGLKPIP